MKRISGLLTFCFGTAATVALAHSGSTGVVLERMNGMTAMRDIMGKLAPMMQGEVPYDALAVSEGGYVIASHAGETMRSLFPDGSIEGVTYAKPEIWSDWLEFSALADELQTYGEMLSQVAPGGLESPAVMTTGMNQSDIGAPSDPGDVRLQEIAALLGYAAPSTARQTERSGAKTGASKRGGMIGMSARNAFEQISATCSACHGRFREGRN